MVNDLWDGAATPSDYRSAASHGFNHYQPEWFWPIDWEEKSGCISEEICFRRVINLPNKLDATTIDKRPDVLFEIPAFRAWYFCCYTERKTDSSSNSDGGVGTFLRGNPAQECQIVLGGPRLR